jgi:hypothetical protein
MEHFWTFLEIMLPFEIVLTFLNFGSMAYRMVQGIAPPGAVYGSVPPMVMGPYYGEQPYGPCG